MDLKNWIKNNDVNLKKWIEENDIQEEWIDGNLFIYLIGQMNKNNTCLIDETFEYKLKRKHKYRLYKYYDKVICKCKCNNFF